MDKREAQEISRLIFELGKIGAGGANLDALLEHLLGVLARVTPIPVRQQSSLLLFNPHNVLVQVAQHGLNDRLLGDDWSGIAPAYEGGIRIESMSIGRLLVLPLAEDDRPLGMVLIAVEGDWILDISDVDFMADLARTLASFVMRCLISETLQVRELDLEEARTDAIRRLGAASEYRDNETGLHVMRMTHIAGAIAKAMGMAEDERDLLVKTAAMHDVGKIAIPDAILLKPGRLDPEEFEVMKTHAELGGQMLDGADQLFSAARDIAVGHHEHWDGSGYPRGLAGEEIPLFARICSVADVFDALTTARPYKEAWEGSKAVSWIHGQAGKKFDPSVVAGFDKAFPEILRIGQLYREDVIDPRQIIDLPVPADHPDDPVRWDETLTIGIDAIDTHHRYLVGLLNDLHRVVHNKGGARRGLVERLRLRDEIRLGHLGDHPASDAVIPASLPAPPRHQPSARCGRQQARQEEVQSLSHRLFPHRHCGGANSRRKALSVRGNRPNLEIRLHRVAREGHDPHCRQFPARPSSGCSLQGAYRPH